MTTAAIYIHRSHTIVARAHDTGETVDGPFVVVRASAPSLVGDLSIMFDHVSVAERFAGVLAEAIAAARKLPT